MNNQMSRRGFITALGSSAAMVVVAGCALGSTDSGKVLTGPANATKTQTINVFDYASTGIEYWVKADSQFGAYFKAKYPHITVNRTLTPFTGYAEALLTALAGGAKYDAIYGWTDWLPQFVQNNAVLTLDQFLANEADLSPDSFYDYGKDIWKSKLYGLAWYASADFLFYNKTAFRKLGIPDPAKLDAAGEWTYDTFQEAAKKGTTGSGDNRVFGMDMGTTSGTGDYSAFAHGWGTDTWNADLTKSTLNSPQNTELWEYIQRFYQQQWTPTPSEGTGLSDILGYGNGRILMMVSGANYFRTAAQDNVPSLFEIGVVRLPKGPGGQKHVCFTNAYYMGTGSSNENGGWTWYKERSFSPTAAKLYVAVGASRFPVRKTQAPVTQYPFESVAFFNSIRSTMYENRVIAQEAKFEDDYLAVWDQMALSGGNAHSLLASLAATSNSLLS